MLRASTRPSVSKHVNTSGGGSPGGSGGDRGTGDCGDGGTGGGDIGGGGEGGNTHSTSDTVIAPQLLRPLSKHTFVVPLRVFTLYQSSQRYSEDEIAEHHKPSSACESRRSRMLSHVSGEGEVGGSGGDGGDGGKGGGHGGAGGVGGERGCIAV